MGHTPDPVLQRKDTHTSPARFSPPPCLAGNTCWPDARVHEQEPSPSPARWAGCPSEDGREPVCGVWCGRRRVREGGRGTERVRGVRCGPATAQRHRSPLRKFPERSLPCVLQSQHCGASQATPPSPPPAPSGQSALVYPESGRRHKVSSSCRAGDAIKPRPGEATPEEEPAASARIPQPSGTRAAFQISSHNLYSNEGHLKGVT